MEMLEVTGEINATSTGGGRRRRLTADDQKSTIKESLKKALGRSSDPSDVKIEEYIEKGKRALVQASMESCMKSASEEADSNATETAKTECRQTAVKKVYATVMLIKEEDVSDVELKRVLKQGADEKV